LLTIEKEGNYRPSFLHQCFRSFFLAAGLYAVDYFYPKSGTVRAMIDS